MTGISYDIVIKDFATGALSKLQKSSLKTEGAVRKMMRSLPEGSKTATPSIDSLRFRLEKLNEGKNASFDTRQIRRFNGEIRKTERQLRKLKDLPPLSVGERFRKLGGGIASLISPAVGITAGLGAITGAFTSAISAGAGFEKEMSNVKALTGASGESFEALNATARQLGATTAFSAREAAEGMSFLAQAGFDTNQITAALPATLNLAAAGSVTLGQAADISSNILSGFGLQAEQTGRVVDVMAKALFFISASLGQIEFEGNQIMAISAISPIAQAMLGKKKGSKFLWMKKESEIIELLYLLQFDCRIKKHRVLFSCLERNFPSP